MAILTLVREYNAVKLIHELSEILKCPDDGTDCISTTACIFIKQCSIFNTIVNRLATMIYNLDYLTRFRRIVTIGGGISQQPFLIQTIQKQFHDLRKQYKEDEHEPVIKACQFQNEANLLGALYHFHTKKGG